MTAIDRTRLSQQLEIEQRHFSDTHPRSQELFQRALLLYTVFRFGNPDHEDDDDEIKQD